MLERNDMYLNEGIVVSRRNGQRKDAVVGYVIR